MQFSSLPSEATWPVSATVKEFSNISSAIYFNSILIASNRLRQKLSIMTVIGIKSVVWVSQTPQILG